VAEVKAVELELALAGTDTAAKPITQALDGSGKLVLEYSSSQTEQVQALLKLGYDRATGEKYSIRILAERGAHSAQEPDE
jgi:hypothetical protein